MDCHKYLPPYHCVTVYFMKDLVAGKKKAVKNTDIVHVAAPQYSALSIEKIIGQATQHPAILDYFPDPRDMAALPRQVSTLPEPEAKFI